MLPFGLGCAAIVIAIDQLSKWLILTEVMKPPRVIEITGFLNLVLVSNKGVSFGLFSSDAVWAQPALASFAALVSILLVFWMRQAQHCFSAIFLGLVVGGALGNAIDRLLHEAVVDFRAGQFLLLVDVACYTWPRQMIISPGCGSGRLDRGGARDTPRARSSSRAAPAYFRRSS